MPDRKRIQYRNPDTPSGVRSLHRDSTFRMVIQTFTLRVLSEEALLILQQLARIQQIQLLPAADSPAEAPAAPPANTARRWRGALSKERGAELQREISEMRDEWDRDS